MVIDPPQPDLDDEEQEEEPNQQSEEEVDELYLVRILNSQSPNLIKSETLSL